MRREMMYYGEAPTLLIGRLQPPRAAGRTELRSNLILQGNCTGQQKVSRSSTQTARPPLILRTRCVLAVCAVDALLGSYLDVLVNCCSSPLLKTIQNDPRRRLVLSPPQVRQGQPSVVSIRLHMSPVGHQAVEESHLRNG